MENKIVKKRIWELDALRGFAFILMAFDHFIYDVAFIFKDSWESKIQGEHFLLKLINFAIEYRSSDISFFIRFALTSGVFLFVSGISANLSRNNLIRGTKLFSIAFLLTIGTIIVGELTNSPGIIIYFGILHCLAVCMLLTPIMKKINKFILIIIGVFIIILGLFLSKYNFNANLIFIPFNVTPSDFTTADYYPLFPFMGIYMLGYVAGGYIYKEKKSLFKKDLNIIPFNYFGRNALWLYFVHQVLLFVILYIITLLL